MSLWVSALFDRFSVFCMDVTSHISVFVQIYLTYRYSFRYIHFLLWWMSFLIDCLVVNSDLWPNVIQYLARPDYWTIGYRDMRSSFSLPPKQATTRSWCSLKCTVTISNILDWREQPVITSATTGVSDMGFLEHQLLPSFIIIGFH